MICSFSSCVDDFSSIYSRIISIGSNIIGTLGSLYSSFEAFDQWSGYISGGLDGWLGFFGPNGFNIKGLSQYSDVLGKFGKGMVIAGCIISWGNSVIIISRIQIIQLVKLLLQVLWMLFIMV